MNNSTVVNGIVDAKEVLGTEAFEAVGEWSGSAKRTESKRGAMADALHADNVLSAYCVSPKKEERDTVVHLVSGDFTRLQVFEALKEAVAAGRGKSDLELYKALPDELATSRKPLRTKLVKIIGSRVGTDIKAALIRREEQAQLDALQEAEDKLAKQEGREANTITKAALTPTRPDEVRIAEALVKIIKICADAEEPDYDATAVQKHVREVFGMIGKVDPTTAA